MKALIPKNIDIPLKPLVAVSLFAATSLMLTILLFKNIVLPPEVPLFYGLAQGENQLAPSGLLVLPILVSVVFLITNTLLTFTTSDDFLRKVLAVSGVATIIFSTITVLRIVLLVGSI